MMDDEQKRDKRKWKGGGSNPGPVYFFGFIGAVIYFIQQASTFWGGVLGVLEAIVWPAILVYHLLQFLRL
jgi:hypothetical protein